MYSISAGQNFIDKYEAKAGDSFKAWTVAGCLADSYILQGDGLKTVIIKECFLNEWSSGYTIRLYNKTPAKYEKIINLLIDGDEQKASDLFYK